MLPTQVLILSPSQSYQATTDHLTASKIFYLQFLPTGASRTALTKSCIQVLKQPFHVISIALWIKKKGGGGNLRKVTLQGDLTINS